MPPSLTQSASLPLSIMFDGVQKGLLLHIAELDAKVLELEAKASEGDVAAAARRVQAMTGGDASPRRSAVAGRLVGTSDWRRASVANTPEPQDAPPPYGASHSPLGHPPEFEAPHFSPPGERRSGVAAGRVVATQGKVCEACTFSNRKIVILSRFAVLSVSNPKSITVPAVSAMRCEVCNGEQLRLFTVQVPPVVASQAQQWRQSPG